MNRFGVLIKLPPNMRFCLKTARADTRMQYDGFSAAELYAQNLQKCYRKKAAVLSLPLLLELRQHTHE
jgi:hypothetical protein